MLTCLDYRFSFEIAGSGQVSSVYYEPEGDQEVIAIKKGFVSILSSRFKKQEEKVSNKYVVADI